jgi:hypothetical protein
MASEIPIPETVEGCVYKLWYASKYVVIKCKTLARSRENLDTGLKYFLKNTPKGRNPNDLYYKFYSYVIENIGHTFLVEIIIATNHPMKLLMTEYNELKKAESDENCLNKSFDVYIPQDTQKKAGSWINRGHYLNFMKWKLRTEAKNTTV